MTNPAITPTMRRALDLAAQNNGRLTRHNTPAGHIWSGETLGPVRFTTQTVGYLISRGLAIVSRRTPHTRYNYRIPSEIMVIPQ